MRLAAAPRAIWWSDEDSNLDGTSRPAGYSRVPYRIGVRSERSGQYRASRSRKVVWVAGFEPAASAFRERPSTGLTIHPVIDDRGSVANMMRGIVAQLRQ